MAVVKHALPGMYLFLRNIQLMEENSLPGIFVTLIMHKPDFFCFHSISIKTVCPNGPGRRYVGVHK